MDEPQKLCIPSGAPLYRITEDDLAELERTMPKVFDRLYPQMDNTLRVQFRRVQEIIVNVRWKYGPPEQVEIIPAGPERA